MAEDSGVGLPDRKVVTERHPIRLEIEQPRQPRRSGVLFGASILGPSGPHTWLSRRILNANNRRGIFDNLGDTEEGLGEILGASFDHVELETVGSMAIFAATNPRR